jgi:hypothetical protein
MEGRAAVKNERKTTQQRSTDCRTLCQAKYLFNSIASIPIPDSTTVHPQLYYT